MDGACLAAAMVIAGLTAAARAIVFLTLPPTGWDVAAFLNLARRFALLQGDATLWAEGAWAC